ncbi:hypothetical protein HAV15_010300 [Penicillium sp. str. |nr:hypothetical protein HAV15_010300 [Penicillium sp. str. \
MTVKKLSIDSPRTLRVAIIGGGPGGLAAGIALSALPNVDVSVFEQAKELREIGAGVSIGYNTWKVLELLDAVEGVTGHRRVTVHHRNGITGDVIGTFVSHLPTDYHPRRVRRTRLQSALLAKIPPGVVQLNKCLITLENLEQGGVQLGFKDGTKAIADLVVGADGIRSITRENIFPEHKMTFTGTSIWRTLIPSTLVSHLTDLNYRTQWWHGPVGFVMTTPIDDPTVENNSEGKVRWGVDSTNERMRKHFMEYGPHVQEVLSLVPEGSWREYSAFAGPRLQSLIGWDKVVLVGDASHPLSGAFGSGAAFAMEDGWLLARVIEYTRSNSNPNPDSLAKALEIFNTFRSPYYLRMYEYLDSQKFKAQGAAKNASDGKISNWEAVLSVKANSMIGEGLSWIFFSDIGDLWDKYVKEQS